MDGRPRPITRLIAPLRDPQSWLDALHVVVLRFPVAVFSFVVTVTFWAIALGGLSCGAWAWALPDSPGKPGPARAARLRTDLRPGRARLRLRRARRRRRAVPRGARRRTPGGPAGRGRLDVDSPRGGPTRLPADLPCACAGRGLGPAPRGLVRLLEEAGTEVVAAVADGPSLVRAVREHGPDVVVVDVRMPPTHTDEGLRAAVEARRDVPGTAVLVLSQYVEVAYADELLAEGRGAVGYLLKDRAADIDTFLEALEDVVA